MSAVAAEAASIQRSGRASRFRWGTLILAAPAAIVVLLLFVLPIGRLVVTSVLDGGSFTFDNYARSFDPSVDPFLQIILRTVLIALAVTASCIVLGYAVSTVAVALKGFGGILVLGIVCLPFFTSALIRTYSWQVILANNGPINQLLLGLGLVDEPVTLVYNDIGVVIGMTQILLPMMVFPLYAAMRTIDPALLSAAKTLGSTSFRAWRTITLPLSLPGIAAGGTLVFIVALGYFTTPVLLQGASTPIFAQRLDTLSGIPGSGGLIAAQATLVLLASIVLLVLFRKPLGVSSGSRTPRASDTGTARPIREDGARDRLAGVTRPVVPVLDAIGGALYWPVIAVLTTLAVAMSVGPIVVIALASFSDSTFLQFPPSSFSLRWYEEVFSNVQWGRALGLSAIVSIVAAIVAVLVAAAAAFVIARSRKGPIAPIGYALLAAPLVVPQVVLAIALYTLLATVRVAGTPTALVLGYIIITLPLAVILLTTAFRGLDPLYERASASLGARPLQTARWVVLPLVIPSMVGALLFSFVTAFSDLVLAQFLGGPRAQTLERLIYQDIRESVSPEVAAVGTMLIAAVLVIGLVAVGTQTLYMRRLRAARR